MDARRIISRRHGRAKWRFQPLIEFTFIFTLRLKTKPEAKCGPVTARHALKLLKICRPCICLDPPAFFFATFLLGKQKKVDNRKRMEIVMFCSNPFQRKALSICKLSQKHALLLRKLGNSHSTCMAVKAKFSPDNTN
jgi:hypothetical protein